MPDQRRPASALRRNLRSGVLDGAFATPWVFLSVPANFLFAALITQYYSVSTATYGLIASFPAWSNALQVALVPIAARFLNGRAVVLSMGWLNLTLWAVFLAALGLLPVGDAHTASFVLTAFFAVASVTASMIAVGWTAWIHDWVPRRVRGKYFGLRNQWVQFASIGFLVVSMPALRVAKSALWPYQALIGLALGLRLASILFCHSIRTERTGELAEPGWFGQMLSLRRERSFMVFVLFTAWSAFWLNVVVPFAPVFVYEHLGRTPFFYSILVAAGTLSGALVTPAWGRLCDRHGAVAVVVVSALLWHAQDFFWSFLTPRTFWVLVPMWLWGGASSAGFFLGSFILLLDLLPESARTAGISLNLAVTSIAAAVAPIAAGSLLGHAGALGYGQELVYRVGFSIAPAMLLVALVALRWVEEPARTDHMGVWGALRTIRQSMSLTGLAWLGNFLPIARRDRPRLPR